jgi:hypothetical protein
MSYVLPNLEGLAEAWETHKASRMRSDIYRNGRDQEFVASAVREYEFGCAVGTIAKEVAKLKAAATEVEIREKKRVHELSRSKEYAIAWQARYAGNNILRAVVVEMLPAGLRQLGSTFAEELTRREA